MASQSINQFDSSFTFNQNDHEVMDYWKMINLIDQLNGSNAGKPVFNSMDGPPFPNAATLHWGHGLISTLKSVMQNYKRMHGYDIYNKNGLDCHGLPIEMVANKELNISTNYDVYNMGIDAYNNKCKALVNSFSDSWNPIFERLGRFMDNNNTYKTMDSNFMETVWNVFKQLHEKNLVYRGYKIMPFSTHCSTPLSNFEAGQNYKMVDDMSIWVKFQLKDEHDTYIIAWTTTPWTLPSNLALCVHPNLTYVKILHKKKNETYIVAQDRMHDVFDIKDIDVIETFLGETLNNVEYVPLFDYFSDRMFKVIMGAFVTADSGTGIVHIAPAFGEEDFNVAITNEVLSLQDIGHFCPVDDNGCYTDTIYDMKNMYVMDANKVIINRLGESGMLIKKKMYQHSYPFCWRTETPLIYKAVSSFFVEVTKIKDDLIENNNKIHWHPAHIGSGLFHNWLTNTCDWGISRKRFFGTPIPAWVSDDMEEIVIVGSIAELMELSGMTDVPTDLHREFMDNITIPSKMGKGVLRRVPDIFDCWFESGAVPLGQIHYPFENNAHVFDNEEYLSEFVCEGVDQTRGWFYTLLVLSTALFNKPPFKHVVCAGLVLDEHGNKISKKLGNFVSPLISLEKFGADAVRLYMAGSPAVHAHYFKFKDTDITVLSNKLYKYFNASKFFIEYYTLFTMEYPDIPFDTNAYINSNNVTDRWMLSRVSTTISNIEQLMESYTIHHVPFEITTFIEDLVNWYIKFNRERIKGKCGLDQWMMSLSTLYQVLLTSCKAFAPFMPFLTETLYQKLTTLMNMKTPSVHLEDYPPSSVFEMDHTVERRMKRLQHVANMVRTSRSKTTSGSIKIPLQDVFIGHHDKEYIDDIQMLEEYLKREINAFNITYGSQDGLVSYKIQPNHKALGVTYRHLSKAIIAEMMKIDNATLAAMSNSVEKNIKVYVNGNEYMLNSNEYDIITVPDVKMNKHQYFEFSEGVMVIIDKEFTEEVKNHHLARLFVRFVQATRKCSNLRPCNKINIYYEIDSSTQMGMLLINNSGIVDTLGNPVMPYRVTNEVLIVKATTVIDGVDVVIYITDPHDHCKYDKHTFVEQQRDICGSVATLLINKTFGST